MITAFCVVALVSLILWIVNFFSIPEKQIIYDPSLALERLEKIQKAAFENMGHRLCEIEKKQKRIFDFVGLPEETTGNLLHDMIKISAVNGLDGKMRCLQAQTHDLARKIGFEYENHTVRGWKSIKKAAKK